MGRRLYSTHNLGVRFGDHFSNNSWEYSSSNAQYCCKQEAINRNSELEL
jgi:hypothetical protein